MRDLCYDNEQLLWRSLRFSLPDGVDGTLLRTKWDSHSGITFDYFGKIYSIASYLISIRIRDSGLITGNRGNYNSSQKKH